MKKFNINNEIKSYFQAIRADSYILWSFLIAIICIMVEIGLYIYFHDLLPSSVPLYYSLSWGQQRLAPTEYLLILPASTMIILIINGMIGAFTLGKDLVLSRILALGTLLFAVLSLVSMIRIIWLII